MIELINVEKRYGKRILFSNINIKIDKAGLYSFIGENGCGKSTLLNIITKSIKASKGKVINKIKSRSFIIQKVSLIEHLTIREHFKLFNIDFSVLKRIKLLSKLDYYPSSLSYGQKQRIACILAIYSNSPLLIVDEPTSHLDEKNALLIMKEIKKISKHKIVLLVSHDLNFINKYSDKIYKVENGSINLVKEKVMINKSVKNRKNRYIYKHYISKSLMYYKNINIIFYIICFLISFMVTFSYCLKYNLNQVIEIEKKYSLDYNKFYLKQCDESQKDKIIIKKCYTLDENHLEILKESEHYIGNNYEALMNYLYDTDKFSVINPYNFILKEGKYPSRYNEIIANDEYQIGDKIKLISNKVVSLNKIDIYTKEIILEVVGITKESLFIKNDKYYLDYNLIDNFMDEDVLISNKINLKNYFNELDMEDYKEVIYFKNVDISILEKNDIEYASSSYEYYKELEKSIEEIYSSLIYLNIIVVIISFYYLIKLIRKKMGYKEEEITLLKSFGVSKKKIIKLITKENLYLFEIAFLFNLIIIFTIVYLLFKSIFIPFYYILILFFILNFINKVLTKVIVYRRISL